MKWYYKLTTANKIAMITLIVTIIGVLISLEKNNQQQPRTSSNPEPTKKQNMLGSLITYDGIEASSNFNRSTASKAFDGNIETVWHSKNNDQQRHILLKYRKSKEISKIRFYRNPNEEWYSQIKEATLTFSDNSRLPVKLKGYKGWEEVNINPPKITTSLKIHITRGTQKTNQLKISEIEIIGK